MLVTESHFIESGPTRRPTPLPPPHIDRSGGLLREKISSYAEDSVGSISASFVLVVAAIACIVRTWKTWVSARQGTPRDGVAAREL